MKTSPELRQRLTFLGAGFAAGVVALGVWVAIWNHPSSAGHAIAPAPQTATAGTTATPANAIPSLPDVAPAATPISNPAVTRVAARFHCVCPDQCALPVSQCQCPTATAERALLHRQLQAGRSEAQAEQALNKQYGGLEL